MIFSQHTTNDAPCDDPRDPDALMRDAHDARNLFLWGTLVDAAGRYLVVKLILAGYERGTAMRVAIQVEQRSITVTPPAEGWRS